MIPLILPVLLGGAGLAALAILGENASSVASLFAPSFEEVGELHTKQAALSQLITFAVLADGEVTDAEADNLRHLFERSKQFTGDADAAVEHLRACARRASDAQALENTIRVVSADLDRAWKDDAFRFVAVLALRGSGFGTGSASLSYRSAPMSDPGALLSVYARGLEVSEEVRESALARARSD